MRHVVRWAAVWVVATLVAVAGAWQAVGRVGAEFTSSRPDPLSDDEIAAAAATSDATGSTTDPTTDPTTDTSAPGGVTDDTSADETVPEGGGPDGTARAEDSPTSSSPTTRNTLATAPTTTSPRPAGRSETRSYAVVGGSVTLRFSPSGASVVVAEPKAGFEVEVEPEHGNGVKVEFRSDDHRSRVDGWWEGGPQDRVREEPT